MSVRGRLTSPLALALIIVVLVAIIFFLFISTGSRVEAKVNIGEDSFDLESYYLAQVYPLAILPEETVTQGDKTLILSVAVGGNEILRAEKQNLGTGVAIIRTGSMPGNVEVGAKLDLTISLLRMSELLHQERVELIFR